MHEPPETPAEYQCPGEGYAISRAVHLGRLARFYPGCRNCEHRHETGSLSPRQVKRLGETARRGQEAPLFQADLVGGLPLGMLAPPTVRNVAAALAICLRRGLPASSDAMPDAGGGPSEPAVVVAGDGRPAVAELVAAAYEGLRWAGCHVVDLGAAGTASLVFAADHLQAAGGLLVGAGPSGSHGVGLKLFGPGPLPLTDACGLDAVRRQFERGADRPTRRYGGLHRFQADEPYLELLRPHFHAIRPLRFVLDCECRPVRAHLDRLVAGLACKAVPGHGGTASLSERVPAEEAHFGAHIDDDGERCRVVDEGGRPVEPLRLLRLVASRLLRADGEGAGTVVLPHDTAWPVAPGAADVPSHSVVRSDPTRPAMTAAMRRSGAACGGTADGRFWYGGPGGPLPDALHTLTHLLALLSRSDRPFSLVLDRESPSG